MLNLSQLNAPNLIEPLDFEALLAKRKAQLISAAPQEMKAGLLAALSLESEPLTLLLQENTYNELLLRQRINDAVKATFLAFASGTDLDHRAADFGVKRLLLQAAEPDTNPPKEAVYEDDERLRYRTQMALEGLSAAGSRGAYLFHALSASAEVLDAQVDSPAPGQVQVWVLSQDKQASQGLCQKVADALSAETVRPLCDQVTVKAAVPLSFSIQAKIEWKSPGQVLAGGFDALKQRLNDALAARLKIGEKVPRSVIIGALQAEGVNAVELIAPAQNIICKVGEYPLCVQVALQ